MKYGNRGIKPRSSALSAWKRVASAPLSVIAALVVCVFAAKAAWNVHQKVEVSAARLAQSQAELAKLEKRRDDLSQKVERLSSDEGIEAEIRTRFRAVREGESVAVIVDEHQVASATLASSTERIGWWGRLLRAVGL